MARAFLIVMDSVGCGGAPDAAACARDKGNLAGKVKGGGLAHGGFLAGAVREHVAQAGQFARPEYQCGSVAMITTARGSFRLFPW